MAFTLEIVSPDRVVFSETVDFISARGIAGELGILTGHEPLFTALVPELVTFSQNGKDEVVAVMGGFMDVRPDKVTILTEAAERATEIDKLRAEKARERAEMQAAKVQDTVNEAALQRAIVRLRALEALDSLRTGGKWRR
jgi:F-type H+-transporting ATPase subunit epsilon